MKQPCPEGLFAFKMAVRSRPWQTAGHVSIKILEILIVSNWQQALLLDLLQATLLNAKKTLGMRLGMKLCPYYGGVCIVEVEFVWNLVSFGPSGLQIVERCSYYRCP